MLMRRPRNGLDSRLQPQRAVKSGARPGRQVMQVQALRPALGTPGCSTTRLTWWSVKRSSGPEPLLLLERPSALEEEEEEPAPAAQTQRALSLPPEASCRSSGDHCSTGQEGRGRSETGVMRQEHVLQLVSAP